MKIIECDTKAGYFVSCILLTGITSNELGSMKVLFEFFFLISYVLILLYYSHGTMCVD